MTVAAAQLVREAIDAKSNADQAESQASRWRWLQADSYASLFALGWTGKRIAVACHVSESLVSMYRKMGRIYPPGKSRPSFQSAYRIVQGTHNPPHVSRNTGDPNWYAPAPYIEAARVVMGGIDLDPSSSKEANAVVGATTFYGIDDHSLTQSWIGRLWWHPPYAQPLIEKFALRLIDAYAAGDVTEACALTNNATETSFYQTLARSASAVCFPAGRLPFWHPTGKVAKPLQGSSILYLGPNPTFFRQTFEEFGVTGSMSPVSGLASN